MGDSVLLVDPLAANLKVGLLQGCGGMPVGAGQFVELKPTRFGVIVLS